MLGHWEMCRTVCLAGQEGGIVATSEKSLCIDHIAFLNVVTDLKDGQKTRGNADEAAPKI